MAQAHCKLGCKVTVLEAFVPLAKDDPELAAVVQEALRTLILLREQAEIRQLRGKLKWEGNLDEQRQSRFIG